MRDRSPSIKALLALVALTCLTVAATDSTGGSKLTASKLSAADKSADGEPAAAAACDAANSQAVHATLDGEVITPPVTATMLVDGREMQLRTLHDELQLTYVHNLLSAEEMASLLRLAEGRNGFARSPLKTQRSGADASGDARRNSSSCPMLWPLVYEGREDELRATGERAAGLLEELALVSNLTSRVAELFTQTGMELSNRFIEPLQLVRYQPSELFSPHHDYHEPAADGSLGSSVQGEQRAFTVLFFGATLPPGDGGETHFPHLKLKVSPTLGDAIVWSNVDEEGAPNPRSLHEGRPPARGEKVAVNCWIADREFDLKGGMQKAVVT